MEMYTYYTYRPSRETPFKCQLYVIIIKTIYPPFLYLPSQNLLTLNTKFYPSGIIIMHNPFFPHGDIPFTWCARGDAPAQVSVPIPILQDFVGDTDLKNKGCSCQISKVILQMRRYLNIFHSRCNEFWLKSVIFYLL